MGFLVTLLEIKLIVLTFIVNSLIFFSRSCILFLDSISSLICKLIIDKTIRQEGIINNA
jgi:hypothetical protein